MHKTLNSQVSKPIEVYWKGTKQTGSTLFYFNKKFVFIEYILSILFLPPNPPRSSPHYSIPSLKQTNTNIQHIHTHKPTKPETKIFKLKTNKKRKPKKTQKTNKQTKNTNQTKTMSKHSCMRQSLQKYH